MENSPWLEPIRGYIALGMKSDALKLWDSLSDEQKDAVESRELLIAIYLDSREYEMALELADEFIQDFPDEHTGYIQAAYCLHELKRTEEASETLQAGPASLREEPLYFYNLGCYELALGKEEAALAWLHRAFDMNEYFRDQALKDSDLKSIRDKLLD